METAHKVYISADDLKFEQRTPDASVEALVARFQRNGFDRLSPCTVMALAHLAIATHLPARDLLGRALLIARTRASLKEAALFQMAMDLDEAEFADEHR